MLVSGCDWLIVIDYDIYDSLWLMVIDCDHDEEEDVRDNSCWWCRVLLMLMTTMTARGMAMIVILMMDINEMVTTTNLVIVMMKTTKTKDNDNGDDWEIIVVFQTHMPRAPHECISGSISSTEIFCWSQALPTDFLLSDPRQKYTQFIPLPLWTFIIILGWNYTIIAEPTITYNYWLLHCGNQHLHHPNIQPCHTGQPRIAWEVARHRWLQCDLVAPTTGGFNLIET